MAAFVIGLSWQTSVMPQFTGLINPPSANAYCSGVLLCGAYHNVCGSCNNGVACNSEWGCFDPSTGYYPCPCGDMCFPAGGGGSWATCAGGSQAACMSTSCDSGYCQAEGSCGWNNNVPTPTAGAGSPPAPGPGCSNCGDRCAEGTTNNSGGNVNVTWENTGICNCGMACAGWHCTGGDCFRPCYGAICGPPPPPPAIPRGVLNGRIMHDVNNNGINDDADNYIIQTDINCGSYSRANQGNIFIEYAGSNGVGFIPYNTGFGEWQRSYPVCRAPTGHARCRGATARAIRGENRQLVLRAVSPNLAGRVAQLGRQQGESGGRKAPGEGPGSWPAAPAPTGHVRCRGGTARAVRGENRRLVLRAVSPWWLASMGETGGRLDRGEWARSCPACHAPTRFVFVAVKIGTSGGWSI